MAIKNPEVYNGYAMSLREIAAIEGVTPERIRQIENRALRKIKHMLLQKYGNSVTLWDILPYINKENPYEQMQSM